MTTLHESAYQLLQSGAIGDQAYSKLVSAGLEDQRPVDEFWGVPIIKHKKKGKTSNKSKNTLSTWNFSPPSEAKPSPPVDDYVYCEPEMTANDKKPTEAQILEETTENMPTSSANETPAEGNTTKSVENLEMEPQSNTKETGSQGKALLFLSCFRCQRQAMVVFGDNVIPDWIPLDGDRKGPALSLICCSGCRIGSSTSVQKMTEAFNHLKLPSETLGSELATMARMRSGMETSTFISGKHASHMDVDFIRTRLSTREQVVSLDLVGMRQGKTGADLEIGYMSGGFF